MHHQYEEHYRAAVEAMISRGVDVYLLDGSALRARSSELAEAEEGGEQAFPRYMAPAFRQQLQVLCRGTLALTPDAAEQLFKRGKSEAGAGVATRPRTTSRA
ncbi:hypothetical protein BTO32_00780 [Marinobacter lutaoensis]|uniref:Uncharacterized protein n=1 Tax=Marinobacter lutaoensis TaxID=135739 RepID=A0A1V2DWX8_9GAMM|nr:hypothetical protein BTO32_00780 [Marinobacter lutaoensis]